TAVDYLVKSLLDPSEHGQRYFDHYVDVVESYIAAGFAGYTFRQSQDTRGQAASLAVMALAPSMLDKRLQANLGTTDTTGTMTRLAPHLLDLLQHGVLETVPPEDTDDPRPGEEGPSAHCHAPAQTSDAQPSRRRSRCARS